MSSTHEFSAAFQSACVERTNSNVAEWEIENWLNCSTAAAAAESLANDKPLKPEMEKRVKSLVIAICQVCWRQWVVVMFAMTAEAVH